MAALTDGGLADFVDALGFSLRADQRKVLHAFAENPGKAFPISRPTPRATVSSVHSMGGTSTYPYPDLLIIDDPVYFGWDIGRENFYRTPDPVERVRLDPPPKPSHKLSPLERAQQGRAARRDMIGKVR